MATTLEMSLCTLDSGRVVYLTHDWNARPVPGEDPPGTGYGIARVEGGYLVNRRSPTLEITTRTLDRASILSFLTTRTSKWRVRYQ